MNTPPNATSAKHLWKTALPLIGLFLISGGCKSDLKPSIAVFDKIVTTEFVKAQAKNQDVPFSIRTEKADDAYVYYATYDISNGKPIPPQYGCLLTIVVLPVQEGTDLQPGQSAAGPEGSSVEEAVRTKDGAFDIRVSLFTLMRKGDADPGLSPKAIAEAVAARYEKI